MQINILAPGIYLYAIILADAVYKVIMTFENPTYILYTAARWNLSSNWVWNQKQTASKVMGPL